MVIGSAALLDAICNQPDLAGLASDIEKQLKPVLQTSSKDRGKKYSETQFSDFSYPFRTLAGEFGQFSINVVKNCLQKLTDDASLSEQAIGNLGGAAFAALRALVVLESCLTCKTLWLEHMLCKLGTKLAERKAVHIRLACHSFLTRK